MGYDWYNFKALCSSGYAIMVTNKDIKETHSPGSSSTKMVTDKDINETHSAGSSCKESDDFLDDPLDKAETAWLLDHTGGFNAYQIGESFVLFTKEHNDMREAPCLNVEGPRYIEEPMVKCHIENAPRGEEYNELLELARKLTPSGSKLTFAPGKYSFSATETKMIPLKKLTRRTGEKANSDSDNESKDHEQLEIATAVPSDFELIVGNGDKKKTIGTNRAVLFCCFPHLETLVSDAVEATKLELPELDPEAVQVVLDTFSSRKKVKRPYRSPDQIRAIEIVLKKFGVSVEETEDPPTKKPKEEHPAIADPRWLDATFLAGPLKEEIKVNRSVLASMNPVLNRVLFGTGVISVDPSKPIEWPDFDAQAVRQVFSALVHCGMKEFVVPFERVDSVEVLMDYLMETREDLVLSYDHPFNPKYLEGFCLTCGEDGDGLKFNE